MRLTINLATRVYVNKRRLDIFIVVTLLVLLSALIYLAAKTASDLEEKGKLDKGIALLEGRMKTTRNAAVPEKEYQSLLGKIKFANGIIRKKSFDWLYLFDQLEGVVPDGVAISSIEPDPKNEELKLTGIAKSFGNLRKFVENLEDSGFFTGVYLLGQTDTQGPEGQKGTGFNITCKAKFR